MKLNSFKSVVTITLHSNKKVRASKPSHSLPTFHSPIFHHFPTFLHLLTHLFILYLFIYDSVQKKKKERQINYLFIAKSLAQRQRLHETLGIKKNLMWKFKIESEREIFILFIFSQFVDAHFLHHRYWIKRVTSTKKQSTFLSHLYYWTVQCLTCVKPFPFSNIYIILNFY